MKFIPGEEVNIIVVNKPFVQAMIVNEILRDEYLVWIPKQVYEDKPLECNILKFKSEFISKREVVNG